MRTAFCIIPQSSPLAETGATNLPHLASYAAIERNLRGIINSWADVFKGAQDLAQNLEMYASAALGLGVADAVEVLLVNVAARVVTQ